jgi:hypothetical protein
LTGAELVQAHVRSFNEGVRSGDWEPMLLRFADDAELRFVGAAAGPFTGIEEIRRSYREHPPDDSIQLLGIQADDEQGLVVAAFVWLRGGTGRLELTHDRGAITRLSVIFDE